MTANAKRNDPLRNGKVPITISRRVAGLLLGGAQLINLDMCATIMRMRRQSQIHRQRLIPTARYQLALFSLRNKKNEF